MKKISFLFVINCQLLAFTSSAQNVGIGTTTPAFKLDVAGSINTDSFYRIKNLEILSIKGNSNLFIGFAAGGSNSGSGNTFCGSTSGLSNTTGAQNSFFGNESGFANTSGHDNSFFGDHAGFNTTTSYNSFFGTSAGSSCNGTSNSLFGQSAGLTVSGDYNAMFGTNAGGGGGNSGSSNSFFGTVSALNNTTGYSNAFFGRSSGYLNDNGYQNSFFGDSAGFKNTAGSENVAIGIKSGFNLTTGSNNTFIGPNTNSGINGILTNSTAIGNGAVVTVSNNFVLGDANVTGWGFGVAAGGRAIKVGTDASNGNGAYLTAGGAWTDVSSVNKKENFTPVDAAVILSKINKLAITKWKYINTKEEYHIGPMAEQFYQLFKIGFDNSLSAMDKSGVALLGIQQLSKENKNLKKTISIQKKKIDNIEKRLLAMEKRLR